MKNYYFQFLFALGMLVSNCLSGSFFSEEKHPYFYYQRNDFSQNEDLPDNLVLSCPIPGKLSIMALGDHYANISWTSSPGAIGHVVQYRKGNGAIIQISIGMPQTTAILTGLDCASDYSFRVGSVCSSASSIFSAWYNFISMPNNNCNATWYNAHHWNVDQSNALVQWSGTYNWYNYDNSITLEYTSNLNGPWTVIQNIPDADVSYWLSGLTSNTTYYWRVRIVCPPCGLSQKSPIYQFTTL